LIYGPDARAQVKAGTAAPLAGMPGIAFTQGEWITRENGKISRRIVGLDEAVNHPAFKALIAPRPNFGPLELNRCHIMGIVNVTPDSFSDGGVHFKADAAVAEAQKMAEDGASILDIGGESTRPGAETVSSEQERDRVMPVIEALAKDHCVSVDTRKAPLMREALSKGAAIINDVAALQFDPDAPAIVSKAKAPVILMHAQGEPRTMQLAPKYDDVALDVYDQLAALVTKAEAAGISRSNIMVDPGIGFGKTFKQNLELLQQMTLLHGLGVGLLIGLSRKGFIGALTHEKAAAKRLGGSMGGALHAAMNGAQVIRVHDVKDSFTALTVLTAIIDPDSADI
jgi:dihydropteroate synthase